MTKHTRGPWQISEPPEIYNEDQKEIIVEAADGFTIAHLILDERESPDTETIKNAYLIAAAPELLEALKEAIFLIKANGLNRIHIEGDWLDRTEYKRWMEAIAKAEGKE